MTSDSHNLVPKNSALFPSAATFGFGVSLTWIAVESWSLFSSGSFSAKNLAVFLGMALAVGAVSQTICLAFLVIGKVVGRKRRSLALVLPLVVILWVSQPWVYELFEGDWVSQQAWSSWARLGLLLVLGVGLYLGGGLGLCWAQSSMGRRRLLSLLLLLFAFLFFWLDERPFLVRKYLAAHHLLAFFGVLFGGLSFLPWGKRGKVGLGITHLVLGILLFAAAASGVVSFASPEMRALVLRSGRLSPFLGVWVLSAQESHDGSPINEDLLQRLIDHQPTRADILDRLMPRRRRQDVILITVDTLRYDALSAHGGQALTPNLDALLDRGRSFENAWSQFPSTRYAVGSFLAGQYPTSVSLKNEQPEAQGANLPESLKENGFLTYAFTSFPKNLFALDRKHLERGFASFVNDSGDRLRKSPRVIERAMAAFRDRPQDDRPIFLWLHLFDPHGPPTDRGGLGEGATLRQRYDREVEFADASLGAFIDFVDKELSNPLLIVHSDHGEEFQEHGGVGHNSSLYEEQIHVPFAFVGEGITPGVCSSPVELIDLPSTIREIVGLPRESDDRGHSLVPILLNQPRSMWPPEYCFAQFRWPQFVNGNLDAIRDGRYKLIHDRRLDLFELYDLKVDPGEQRDIALSQPQEVARMGLALSTFRFYAGSVRESSLQESTESLLLKLKKGSLRPQDFKKFRKHLRRGDGDIESILPSLLNHPDTSIRLAAGIHTATYKIESGVAALKRRAESSDVRARNEARVFLAIAGDDISLAEIPLVMPEFSGPHRILPFLARRVCGDVEMSPALHQIFSGPGNDVDLDTLVIQVLVRIGDMDFLPALYTRIGLGSMSSEQTAAAVQVSKFFPFELSSPILRRVLCSPDQGLRKLALEAIASDARFSSWKDKAIEAERLALRAKHLFNGKKETITQCFSLLQQGIEKMAQAGLLDYGLILDASILANAWGKRADLLPLADSLVKTGKEGGQERLIVDRLVAIARSPRRKCLGKIELLPGQGPREGESGVIPLLVRVTLFNESAPMVGGMALGTEYLGAELLDGKGDSIGFPMGLIFPLTGVQPGESTVLAVPLLVPPTAGDSFVIAIDVGRGANKKVLEPLRIEVQRGP